jgi:hypothetical protein
VNFFFVSRVPECVTGNAWISILRTLRTTWDYLRLQRRKYDTVKLATDVIMLLNYNGNRDLLELIKKGSSEEKV